MELMRSGGRAVAPVVLLLALLTGCSTPTPVPPPAGCDAPPNECMRDLMHALEAWRDAYNSRDARQLQQLYAPGALINDDEYSAVPLSGPALTAYFDTMAQRPTARMRWIFGHVQLFGDTAVRAGEYEFVEERSGQPVTRPARYSFAYRWMDGRWLIVLQHSTVRP